MSQYNKIQTLKLVSEKRYRIKDFKEKGFLSKDVNIYIRYVST